MTRSLESTPSANREELLSSAEALAIELDESQTDTLLKFVDQLQRWNRTYNLTAIRDPQHMLQSHIVDSLAVLPWLDRWLEGTVAAAGANQPIHVMDVGSGGGLPGIVLALMRPAWQVTCVDAVEKKTSFVRQMRSVLALGNLAATHARVERLTAAPHHIVISRAFASLSDFATLASQHVKPSGILVAMKGKYPEDEIVEMRQLHPGWQQVHHASLQVPGLEAERCLLAFQCRGTSAAN